MFCATKLTKITALTESYLQSRNFIYITLQIQLQNKNKTKTFNSCYSLQNVVECHLEIVSEIYLICFSLFILKSLKINELRLIVKL